MTRLTIKDTFFIVMALVILACIVWTSYQVFILAKGDLPSFAEAGSYYWEVVK